MSFNKYVSITKLNTSRIKWSIRVRAQAIWRSISREQDQFRGINLIFIDDSSYRIHAFINAKYAELFENELEQGQVYNVKNFMVQEYTGLESYRCVRSEKHIFFADYTKLEKAENEGLKIPHFSFDLFSLKEIEAMEQNKRFLCDVVGIIKDPQPLREYKTDNDVDKAQKKFSIIDGRCCIKVTLFDQLAMEFEQTLRKQVLDTVIVVLTSAKIGTFQGEVTLTNFPATKFFLNINHKSVNELRKRSTCPNFWVKDTPKQIDNELKLLSVKDIKNLTKEHIEQKVLCRVTLRKIQDDLQWYINVCCKCEEELESIEGRFKCNSSKCGRFIPYPDRRFQLCTLCSDNTGGIRIILEDTEVRRITGKTMFDVDLEQAMGENDGKFPATLQSLVNKEYTITLKISEDNLINGSEIFKSCDIFEGNDLLQTNTMMPETSLLTAEDEGLSETNQALTCAGTEVEHTKQSSTKNRVRKTPEKYKNDDKIVPAKLSKNVNFQKISESTKKRNNTKTTKKERLSSKSQSTTIIETEEYCAEEHISLKKFGKMKKKSD